MSVARMLQHEEFTDVILMSAAARQINRWLGLQKAKSAKAVLVYAVACKIYRCHFGGCCNTLDS